jgi:hypothetical protein
MRNLQLSDMKLALRDLFEKRGADLLLSLQGKAYAPQLKKKLAEIEALPASLTSGRPLAQELTDEDNRHDGAGEAIYYYTEFVSSSPLASDAKKAAARGIRDALVPRLGVLRDAYASEAASAARNRAALDTLKKDLQSMPIPDGGTLYDCAVAYVEAGEKIGALLSDRSLAGNAPLPPEAKQIRQLTLGLLGRFRAALADELADDKTLPANLDQRIFSMFDELQAMRGSQRSAKTSREGKEPAADPKAAEQREDG